MYTGLRAVIDYPCKGAPLQRNRVFSVDFRPIAFSVEPFIFKIVEISIDGLAKHTAAGFIQQHVIHTAAVPCGKARKPRFDIVNAQRVFFFQCAERGFLEYARHIDFDVLLSAGKKIRKCVAAFRTYDIARCVVVFLPLYLRARRMCGIRIR